MQTTASETARPRRSLIPAVFATLRPKQWVKNLFVFGPLLFSKRITHSDTDLRAAAGFALFCMASSAVYILNDLRDVEADRQHPSKRFRPIAAGEISRGLAITLSILLAAASLAGGMLLHPMFAGILLCYMAFNVVYSLGLKQVVIVDVMMIGVGFVLRVLGGASAISVPPSHWLVLCTFLLSLFLGFTKRRAELALLEEKATEHRRVLTSYSASFLDQMISVVTATTLICYVMYTVDARTVSEVSGGSRGLLLTVPFVIYGIFRYFFLVYHREQGDSPTLVLLQDKMLLLSVVLWAAVCVAVVYCPQYFKGWFSPTAIP